MSGSSYDGDDVATFSRGWFQAGSMTHRYMVRGGFDGLMDVD